MYYRLNFSRSYPRVVCFSNVNNTDMLRDPIESAVLKYGIPLAALPLGALAGGVAGYGLGLVPSSLLAVSGATGGIIGAWELAKKLRRNKDDNRFDSLPMAEAQGIPRRTW